MPEGGDIYVETRTQDGFRPGGESKRWVHISVRDTGPGISGEMNETMFNPFISTKANGLGLGLSISRSIIEAHGGRLWAASIGSGGAEFRFSLPVLER